MPSEWDAYLRRMGRVSEIGSGASGGLDFAALNWDEVEEPAPKERRENCTAENGEAPWMADESSRAAGARHAEEGPSCAQREGAFDPRPASDGQPTRPPEHVARAFPERARQFMPFAALKGYEEMLAETEAKKALAEDGERKLSIPMKATENRTRQLGGQQSM